MLEVETKFKLDNEAALVESLSQTGAVTGRVERHADTYFAHPSRNFAETNEALRIRSIDSVASFTYKGPKLDVGDRALKARKEIEWCLAPGDPEGQQLTEVLTALGFTPVATVRKVRRCFGWPDEIHQYTGFAVTIDNVEQVGLFAEIELLVPESSVDAVEAAGERINDLSERLGLTQTVRKSYLQLLLDS